MLWVGVLLILLSAVGYVPVATRQADLVTSTADGLLATPLPLLFDPASGEHGALLGHVARNNAQWRRRAG